MKHLFLAVAVAVSAGCRDPGDHLFQPDPNPPIEVAPGLFRLTTSAGNDYVRGFDPDGRIILVSHSPPGGDTDEVTLVSLDPSGGAARAEGGVYGTLLPGLELSDYLRGPAGRYLFAVRPPAGGIDYCGDLFLPAPSLTYVGWRLYRLPEADGQALTDLVSASTSFPLIEGAGLDSSGRPITPKHIREVPSVAEAGAWGTPAFGPAITDGMAFLSNGVTIQQVALDDLGGPPQTIAVGAYPSLSGDGSTLFFARPVIADSVETVTVVPYGLFACTQVLVSYSVSSWQVVARDLAAGTENQIGEGAEPVDDGAGGLIVRRPDGLFRMRLSDGSATLLVPDPTATSPRLSADGTLLAFTTRRYGNADVMVLRLN